ncbi:VOC family protein [Pseudalkalibacillus sp. SCS-8]|uniref:VOC family protein n=1 Tax=Pseudalkalibacillus nanhaiensis TaxID=3115291 RepID=UPI0032DA334B
MKSVKRIDSVFVPVTDMERSEKWYKEVFPFEVVYRSSDGQYVGFRFAEKGELKTALTIYKVEKLPERNHMAFNFYAEDVDAFHSYLTSNGYEASEIHAADGMRFFDFYDPDQNELGVVTFEEVPMDQIK